MVKDWLMKMINEYDHPSVILWRAIELKTVDQVLEREKVVLVHPILDLGCGEGKIAEALFGRGQIDYGLDNWQEMVESARRSGVYREVVLGNACKLPFKDRMIGTVFSNCVIEHIEGIDRVLSEVSRVLKDRGVFIFTVPSSNFSRNLSLHKIFNFFGFQSLAKKYSDFRNRKLNHYNCFRLPEWRKRLEINDLKIENYQFYIAPGTLFIWDLCALLVFPMTLLGRVLRLGRVSFPLRSNVLKAIFDRFYRETVHNNEGSALLLVTRKV